MREGIPETVEELEAVLTEKLGPASKDLMKKEATQAELDRDRAYWFCAIVEADYRLNAYELKDHADEILSGAKPVDDEWVKSWLNSNFHELDGWEEETEEREAQKERWENALKFYGA